MVLIILFTFVFSIDNFIYNCDMVLITVHDLFQGVYFFLFIHGVEVICCILFVKYLIAASFCSNGWQESLGMMASVVVGFVHISKVNLSLSFLIVRSRKFILLSCSCSNAPGCD
jgi:hypothetical protein